MDEEAHHDTAHNSQHARVPTEVVERRPNEAASVDQHCYIIYAPGDRESDFVWFQKKNNLFHRRVAHNVAIQTSDLKAIKAVRTKICT